MNNPVKNTRKLQGVITSDKMDKTRVVLVKRTKAHPKYGKYYQISKKFKAHDPRNEYPAGTEVIIEACRPLSRDKRWRIIGRVDK